MWLAAVLASALVRSTVLLTDAVPAVRGYVGGDGGGDGGDGGGGGADGGNGGDGDAGGAESKSARYGYRISALGKSIVREGSTRWMPGSKLNLIMGEEIGIAHV